jgi:hypothetical protein
LASHIFYTLSWTLQQSSTYEYSLQYYL